MDDTFIRPAPDEVSARLGSDLAPGSAIAARFTVEAQVGRGGMGAVYRARDGLHGGLVALKVLHADNPDALQRFHREAALLATLRHPGIVGYVAHGTADGGRPFLAMEWLQGEDLSTRLARQSLSPGESFALLRRAADALAAAHQRGVIHRDLKPSNLFLRGGSPDDVVLLDFGLARNAVPSRAMTQSQMVLGTPGYMAPEQISSNAPLSPAADVFSLGCVLYECLAGQPPFAAPHFVAALAKILFSEPPPLRAARPELPEVVEELLGRMLAKEPARRLPDAMSVASALAALQARLGVDVAPSPASESLGSLAGAEQQVVSVLLAAPRGPASTDTGFLLAMRDTLRSLLSPVHARVELVGDGALAVALVASHGSAADPATLAARCALSLQERWPAADVVLTTGRGRPGTQLPVGEAMDRAGQLLRRVEHSAAGSSGLVLLDEVTAGLLGPGFQLSRSESGLFFLRGEQLSADESRPLMGKPTPCVGREQELATLEAAFSACVEDSIAQAFLVTAPAGMGKSRLRHELLRRLERQGRPMQVLLARGDPMSAGSVGGLLGQALRALCGITGGEPLEERRARLSGRLGRHLPPAHAREALEFLGELCGIPFADERSLRLRAAREDPALMNAQVALAWVAFLEAECAHHPVLLVLEDLHWGDMIAVRLVDQALRELAESPFMVLALARPEVEELLASTPLARRPQQLPLRGLSRKAGARLVHEVIGADVPGAVIDRLLDQAAGNALFLEELIRAVAEGRGESTPGTVVAMLQARLTRLEPAARQVLLAASVFGRAFWSGGLEALLGPDHSREELGARLQQLVAQEWIEPQPRSRFPGEAEYRFRHALVRDAAYGLLSDDDKSNGHRRAGAWLEQTGESDPRVLAEHASLGQQPERAIHFYLLAADQHMHRYNTIELSHCVEAALALGPRTAERVRLRALQATASFWRQDFSRLFEVGPEVLAELTPGSQVWSWLANGLYAGYCFGGMSERTAELGRQLVAAEPDAGAESAYAETLATAHTMLLWRGAREESSSFRARLDHLAQVPSMRPWAAYGHGSFSFFFEPKLWRASLLVEQSHRQYGEVGRERDMVWTQILWAMALEALGDRGSAEAQLRDCASRAPRFGQPLVLINIRLHLAMLLAGSPEPATRQEALALANSFELDRLDHFHGGLACLARAKVAAADGDLLGAEAWARKTCALHAQFVCYERASRTVWSRVLLAQGRVAEAREVAALGVDRLEGCGGEGWGAVGIRLALAEACFAARDEAAGEQSLRRALTSLRECARDIPEPAARERFLAQVPENARALELARQRWGEIDLT